MTEWQLIIGDVIVLLGTGALTLAVLGVLRIPEPNAKLHASSKGVVLGVLGVLAASVPGSDAAVVVRAVLVGILLLITASAGTHALAKLQAQISEISDSNE